MKNTEFHKPFIKSLSLVAIVTIGAMIFSHYLVNYYSNQSLKTPVFTSQESQYSSVSPQ
jgi:hypothetical protein